MALTVTASVVAADFVGAAAADVVVVDVDVVVLVVEAVIAIADGIDADVVVAAVVTLAMSFWSSCI